MRELRKASGLSQEAFADKCGFARSYMSRVERGGANPSLDAIQIIADGLAIPVESLFKTQETPLNAAENPARENPAKKAENAV